VIALLFMMSIALQSFSVSNASFILEAFNLARVKMFSRITERLKLSKTLQEIDMCFNSLFGRNQKPIFKYRIVNNAKEPWKVDVMGISYSLVRTGSLSPSVPEYAWTNSAILCLHDIYHAQNTTVFNTAETYLNYHERIKQLRNSTLLHPRINIIFTFDMSTYGTVFHHNNQSNSLSHATTLVENMMRLAWMQIMGYGGVCNSNVKRHRICNLYGHWTLNDLNKFDTNDVPMLICNKWDCVISSGLGYQKRGSHKHDNDPVMHNSMMEYKNMHQNENGDEFKIDDILLSSGWTYKTKINVPDSSRQIFDWYKFLYEHFHLHWLTLEYKPNQAQRVQLFSVEKRSNDVALIKRANISLIVLACSFNVVVFIYLAWSTFK